MQKVAIVTGGTSGIGLETARALEAAGVVVWTISRRETGEARHIACDVSDPEQTRAAAERVYRESGSIDILVNCAGFGISGAFEFTHPSDARRQIDVNLHGTANMMQAVLPYMRQAGRGRIVNTGSVAGIAPIPFQAWYTASKAALQALTMAVANEVAPFGITLTAAMPGDIRTGFTDARKKNPVGDDLYGGRIARSVAKMEKDEQNGMPASFAGKKLAKLALKKSVRPAYSLGIVYKACAVLIKFLPGRTVRFLLGKLYGG
ncbi:MAG: SDR family NAD(P)-dependent oxidoreductase [Clostridia bacterium]|nr:SDR family NAD(P)-dependent oxidoreductase [Clostridia bacterium]